MCGVRLVSGSWKIIVIFEPRSLFSFAGFFVCFFWSRYFTLPVAVPLPASNLMVVWKSWLLPEPDSPTTPRHSPSSMVKFALRTACTAPSGVEKRTSRLLTSKIGALISAIHRVEGVAQAIADKIEAEQGDRHEGGREDQHPGRGFHLVRAILDQHAP